MLLWITPAYRLQPKIPIFRCHDCGSHDNLSVCTTCGERVCPSCRCGTGSIDDGYECLSHWRVAQSSNRRESLERALRRPLDPDLAWRVITLVLALSILILLGILCW